MRPRFDPSWIIGMGISRCWPIIHLLSVFCTECGGTGPFGPSCVINRNSKDMHHCHISWSDWQPERKEGGSSSRGLDPLNVGSGRSPCDRQRQETWHKQDPYIGQINLDSDLSNSTIISINPCTTRESTNSLCVISRDHQKLAVSVHFWEYHYLTVTRDF